MRKLHTFVPLLLGVTILLIVIILAALVYAQSNSSTLVASDYESCAKQTKAKIQQSYPSICVDERGNRYENPQERAIFEAQRYNPGDKMCTQVMTEARHIQTGATYTFSSGCLPPGWEKL